MKWNYLCPKCKEWRVIDWKDIDTEKTCHKTQEDYFPPRPKDQSDAFVETHEWPLEMEKAVVAKKGNKCTVPGCTKNYETLDHRIPYINEGKTSVDNLYPMCNHHNQSKGDTNYAAWLNSLTKK